MQIIRMIIALLLIILIANWLSKDKEKVIYIAILYFLIDVFNDIINVGSPIELANAFGFSLQLGDFFSLALLFTIVLNMINECTIKRSVINLIIVIIILLVLCSAFNGLITFKFTSEWIGDVRTFAGFLIWMLYFKRFGFFEVNQYEGKIIFAMNIVLIATIVLWIADIAFGLNSLPSQINALRSDGGSTMRFIQSQRVIIIAIYGLYRLRRDLIQKGWLGMYTLLILAVAILFQHRSVWMALVFGFISIIIMRDGTKISRKFFLQVIGLIAFTFIFMAFSNSDIVGNVIDSFGTLVNLLTGGDIEHTTAITRTNVWNAVIDDLNGISVLIGRPFGYGYARSIQWQTSPHSGYIRMIGRTGFLGLALLILICVLTVVKNAKLKNYVLIDLVLAFMGYMYAYDFCWIGGMVIGVSLFYSDNNLLITQGGEG